MSLDPSPQPPARPSLRAGALGLRETLAVSLEAMGPLLGALVGVPLVISLAGAGAPLVLLIGLVAMFCVAHVISRFAKVFTTSAALYAYVRAAFGDAAAFVTGWISLGYYALFVPQLALAFGIFGRSAFIDVAGVDVPWMVWALGGTAVAAGLGWWGIRLSARIDLAVAAIANGILAAVALAVLIKVAQDGQLSLAPLSPANIPHGLVGLSLAITGATLAFLGFEQSFALGEETRDASSTIPRAMLVALAAVGALLVGVAFAIVLGFGVHDTAAANEAFTRDGTPWWELIHRRLSPGWRDALEIAAIVSVLGNLIASLNVVARLLYGMARAEALPASLGRAHHWRLTPHVAIAIEVALTVVVCLIAQLLWHVTDLFIFLGFMNGLAGAVAFVILLAAGAAYFHRTDRQAGAVRNWVVPLVGVAILLPAIYTSVWPGGGGALDRAPWLLLGWAAVGTAIALSRKLRSRSSI